MRQHARTGNLLSIGAGQRPSRRRQPPPPPPEPVWPRAPPPPAQAAVAVAAEGPCRSGSKSETERHARARWRVAADAWHCARNSDRDAALASDPLALAKMRATAIVLGGRFTAANYGRRRRAGPRRSSPSDDDDLSATSSDTSVEAPPPGLHRRPPSRLSLRPQSRRGAAARFIHERRATPPTAATGAVARLCTLLPRAGRNAATRPGADQRRGARYPRDRRLETPLHARARRPRAEGPPSNACPRCATRRRGNERSAVRRAVEARRPHGPALRRGTRREARRIDVDRARARRGRRIAAGVRRARPAPRLAAAAGGGRAALVRELVDARGAAPARSGQAGRGSASRARRPRAPALDGAFPELSRGAAV